MLLVEDKEGNKREGLFYLPVKDTTLENKNGKVLKI